MDVNSLQVVISLLIALSVATERLTEILKSFSAYLNHDDSDPVREARRQAAVQGLAVFSGIVVSALSWPISVKLLPGGVPGHFATVLALGLLASGGSGFWNSILGYVTNLKNLQEASAAIAKNQSGAARPIPQPTVGVLAP
jgi:hypothetical protein